MGHGHVKPNPDGSVARCGGPAICKICAAEQASLKEKRETKLNFVQFKADIISGALDVCEKHGYPTYDEALCTLVEDVADSTRKFTRSYLAKDTRILDLLVFLKSIKENPTGENVSITRSREEWLALGEFVRELSDGR